MCITGDDHRPITPPHGVPGPPGEGTPDDQYLDSLMPTDYTEMEIEAGPPGPGMVDEIAVRNSSNGEPCQSLLN